ncbi:hypothetical protein QD712_25680 [Streptomyces acidiscabies]|uniref:hypothetical protein n=1 Tax=Streptomyces acidiscabies TaxID=42234 RepID=UPI0030CD90D7
MTPAETLRTAAERLRALSLGAPANNASWRYVKGSPNDSVRTESGWEVCYGDAPGDLRYIAAMHPGVGLALGELLVAASLLVAGYPELGDDHDREACDDFACDVIGRTLTLARQILGTTP